MRSKKKFSIMKTKKIQILKEVVRDVLIVLGLAMVVVGRKNQRVVDHAYCLTI